MPFSSVAWSSVSVPLSTCPWISDSIFAFMSPDGLPLLLRSDARLESIESSAVDSAL